MTIESNGYKTAYNVEILPAVGPPRPTGKVISYPKQTEYKVGDRFYVDGYKVVAYDSKGKEVPVEPREVTFFTSISNTMIGVGSQCGGGYQFSTSGSKVVEVRYNYVTIGKFTINVAEKKSTTAGRTSTSSTTSTTKSTASTSKSAATVKPKAMAEGWYTLRAMNNYPNTDASGAAELRKKTSNQAYYVENKGDGKVALRMKNGKYLGLSGTLKDGLRVRAVDKPYLWTCYSENNNDIFSLRPSGDTKFVMNASGEKNTDGTHIIIWTHTNKNAPNHAEFRFIKVQNP